MKATVTWKEYTDAEIRAVREAVDKVEATNNAKFEAQNEWRGSMKDRESTYVTRRELWGAVLGILAILLSATAIIIKLNK